MDRRIFTKLTAATSIVGITNLLTGCGLDSQGASELREDEVKTFKAFAYYEGLSPDGTRSASRTDGTYHNMPCIKDDDLGEEDEEKVYEFWHSHSAQHTFTLTRENFETLRAGEDIEVYTNVVDGHRHALKVSAAETCGN